ncbi:unnamed protein product [Nezara viridula]|uniref:Uncharacterized protein n=1 Tax=Nezara viridula TaxID=85310 RepID=A0A9P0HNB0_NEZVI|nr:unnamed protein product [Nezara viridula]
MHWLKWFKSDTFCCVFSLQSGAVMSIMVLSALGITALVNIIYYLVTSSTFELHIVPFCLALAYILVLGVGVVLAFCGAYSESTFWMVLGAVFTFVALIIYIIIVIMSFIPDLYNTACISLRCPEHLWLQKSYWRREYNETETDETEEDGNGNNTDLVDEKEAIRTTLFRLPTTTTRLISHRRLRPNPITMAYGMRKGPGSSLVAEEEVREQEAKEEFLCQKREKKFIDESDEDLDYCPPEGREGQDDSGVRVFSAIMSVVYVICYIVFQAYCLYGFLCFANELRKEVI